MSVAVVCVLASLVTVAVACEPVVCAIDSLVDALDASSNPEEADTPTSTLTRALRGAGLLPESAFRLVGVAGADSMAAGATGSPAGAAGSSAAGSSAAGSFDGAATDASSDAASSALLPDTLTPGLHGLVTPGLHDLEDLYRSRD